jgi:hypothetical protein
MRITRAIRLRLIRSPGSAPSFNCAMIRGAP